MIYGYAGLRKKAYNPRSMADFAVRIQIIRMALVGGRLDSVSGLVLTCVVRSEGQ